MVDFCNKIISFHSLSIFLFLPFDIHLPNAHQGCPVNGKFQTYQAMEMVLAINSITK